MGDGAAVGLLAGWVVHRVEPSLVPGVSIADGSGEGRQGSRGFIKTPDQLPHFRPRGRGGRRIDGLPFHQRRPDLHVPNDVLEGVAERPTAKIELPVEVGVRVSLT